jgi:erythronate-4-phosphate dehydrogenase
MDRPVILVDKDIPWGIEAFDALGKVVPYVATDLAMDPSILADATVLACRSTTRLDCALLSAAPRLRVVATPVIGRDHIVCEDVRTAQRARGHAIEVFSAPGSTAAGVADWVVSSILTALPAAASLPRFKVGIWGFGNCGKALAARLSRLRVRWIAFDPPLQVATSGAFLSASQSDLADCDVVTVHVPLTGPQESNWPTRLMIGEATLSALSAGKVRLLCNTSRGAVLEHSAVIAHMAGGRGPMLALDVFEGEPVPDVGMISGPRIATAHLAGSVLEGRRRAVAKVRDDVRRYLRLPLSRFPMEPAGGFDRPVPLSISGRQQLRDVEEDILLAVPIDEWTRSFRNAYLSAAISSRAAAFEASRRGGTRREIRWNRLRQPH